jgi:hypothetical protein
MVTCVEFEGTVVPQVTKHLYQVLDDTLTDAVCPVCPAIFVQVELLGDDCH